MRGRVGLMWCIKAEVVLEYNGIGMWWMVAQCGLEGSLQRTNLIAVVS